jgi:hypothetical protein
MARTHGTRSAYNAGCRCDACREASRLARARQRGAERCHLVSPAYGDAVASSDGPAISWAVVALVCLGTGGFALWKGATLQNHEDVDGSCRRTRRKWILAGIGFIAFGLIAISRIERPDE